MTEAQLIHYAHANWDQTPEGFALSERLAGTWVKTYQDGQQFIWTREQPWWRRMDYPYGNEWTSLALTTRRS